MLKKTQDKNRNFVGSRWILDTLDTLFFFVATPPRLKIRFFLVFCQNDQKKGVLLILDPF